MLRRKIEAVAPGCFSAADEIDDVFAMASEALELCGEEMREEGAPVAEPRGLAALWNDPDWAGSFADA
jgi:predicted RNase H-like HicB family nuclease